MNHQLQTAKDAAASEKMSSAAILSEPLAFPCGRTAPNRLVKAPTEEMLADAKTHLPTNELFTLYRHWAQGGWGMILTGNICVDRTHLGTPFDVALEDPDKTSDAARKAFKEYARAIKGLDQEPTVSSPPLAIAQMVHAGRQSMRGSGRPMSTPALAPSAIPVRASSNLGPFGNVVDWALFGTCVEMTKAQINDLIERFAAGAALFHASGFDGVEIHGSHGYQIAAFLSPRTNKRTDEYGGDARGRIRLLLEIVDAVRKRVPTDFVVGVKLNSSDYVQGGLSEDDALLNVQWLAEHGGVDFVEISGGNYENPSFLKRDFDAEAETAKVKGLPVPSKRTQQREAFFHGFAQRARDSVKKASLANSASRQTTEMKLYLTGGLRTRRGMAGPIADGIVDGVAIARLACVYPSMPKTILDASIPDADAAASPAPYTVRGEEMSKYIPLKLVGAGYTTFWHVGMMSYLSRNEKQVIDASPFILVLSTFAPSLLRHCHAVVAVLIGLFVGLCAFVRLLM